MTEPTSAPEHPLGQPASMGLGEARVETLSERLNKSPRKMPSEDRRQIVIALRAQADKFRLAVEGNGGKPPGRRGTAKVKEEIAPVGAALSAPDDLDLGL